MAGRSSLTDPGTIISQIIAFWPFRGQGSEKPIFRIFVILDAGPSLPLFIFNISE